MSDDMTTLREQLRTLTERVAALEEAPIPPSNAPAHPTDGDDKYWALSGLRSRLASHPATAEGQVMLVGSLTLPTGTPISWQQSIGTTGTLETDWSDLAPAFAALGHPVRLELLRHILTGTHSTAELAAIESLGTTGQLHHHLRQLVSAGWVRQSGRGSYEIPAARIVPLLGSVMGAER